MRIELRVIKRTKTGDGMWKLTLTCGHSVLQTSDRGKWFICPEEKCALSDRVQVNELLR